MLIFHFIYDFLLLEVMEGRQNDEDELEVMATAEDPTPA